MEPTEKHPQPVSTALTDSASQNSTDNNRNEPLNGLLLERFFRAMQIEFGNRWSSQFPTPQSLADAKLEWGAKLENLTGDQIRAGLDAMDVGQQAWPLGPRGFVKLVHEVYHPPWEPVAMIEKAETRTEEEIAENKERISKLLADTRAIFSPDYHEKQKSLKAEKPKEKRYLSDWITDTLSGKCKIDMTYQEWVKTYAPWEVDA